MHIATRAAADLRWNELGVSGGRAIAGALERNRSLTSVPLSGNSVDEAAQRAIGRLLKRNARGGGGGGGDAGSLIEHKAGAEGSARAPPAPPGGDPGDVRTRLDVVSERLTAHEDHVAAVGRARAR